MNFCHPDQDNSTVHLYYLEGLGYVCGGCRYAEWSVTKDKKIFLNHLGAHEKEGDEVPQEAIRKIKDFDPDSYEKQ